MQSRDIVLRVLTAEHIVNSEVAGERSVRKAKMIRRHSLETLKTRAASLENGNEVAQREKSDCGQVFFRNN